MPTYLPNIPGAMDQLSVSQGQLLGNFQQLATVLNANTATLTLAVQGGDPDTNTSLQMYSKVGINGNPQLFIERETGSTDAPLIFDFTEKNLVTRAGQTNCGWTRLPSGILLQWGLIINVATNNYNVTFPISFTGNPYSVTATAYQNNVRSCTIQTYFPAGFTIGTFDQSQFMSSPAFYFAVGI